MGGGGGGGDDIGWGHHRYYYSGSDDNNNLQIVTGKVYTSDNHHPYVIRSLPLPPRSPVDSPPPSFYSKYDLVRDRRGGGKVGGIGGSAWCFSDPEMRRKKRVASYKAYSVEGKLKAKIRRGFRWIKNRCHVLVHGY